MNAATLLHVFRALEPNPLSGSRKRADDPQHCGEPSGRPQEGFLVDGGTAVVDVSKKAMHMDIRAIVEQTLVAPMREQAAQLRFHDNVKMIEKSLESKQQEIQRLNSLCDSYRRMNASLEHLLGELHTRFENKAARDELLLWDEMADMVRDQFRAIHGPSDKDL